MITKFNYKLNQDISRQKFYYSNKNLLYSNYFLTKIKSYIAYSFV